VKREKKSKEVGKSGRVEEVKRKEIRWWAGPTLRKKMDIDMRRPAGLKAGLFFLMVI
jgi:hypothetical protein